MFISQFRVFWNSLNVLLAYIHIFQMNKNGRKMETYLSHTVTRVKSIDVESPKGALFSVLLSTASFGFSSFRPRENVVWWKSTRIHRRRPTYFQIQSWKQQKANETVFDQYERNISQQILREALLLVEYDFSTAVVCVAPFEMHFGSFSGYIILCCSARKFHSSAREFHNSSSLSFRELHCVMRHRQGSFSECAVLCPITPKN